MGAGRGKNKRTQGKAMDNQADNTRDGLVLEKIFAKLEEICSQGCQPDNQDVVASLLSFRAGDLEKMTAEANKNFLFKVSHLISKNSDPAVRCAATIATTRLRGKKAAKELIAALRDQNGVVRQAAVLAVGAARVVEAHLAAEAALQDNDSMVRSSAKWALQRLEEDEDVQEILVSEFGSFLDSVSADDFKRFNHYNE